MCHSFHNLAPPNRGGLNSTHIHGAHAPVEEPSTASAADIELTGKAHKEQMFSALCTTIDIVGRGSQSLASRFVVNRNAMSKHHLATFPPCEQHDEHRNKRQGNAEGHDSARAKAIAFVEAE
jgi:hypothetical protein